MDTTSSNTRRKRKSIAKTDMKPSKIFKSEEQPEAETSENNAVIASIDKSVGTQGKDQTKKKQNKLNTTLKNGEGSKTMQKFEGVNSLTADKQNKKLKPIKKRDYLMLKLNERLQEEGRDAVVQSLNGKIDAILSRPELTKTAKRKLKSYKQLINKVSGNVVDSAAKPAEPDSSKKKTKQMKKSQQYNKVTDENAENKNIKVPLAQKKLLALETESNEEESSDTDYVPENTKIGNKLKKQFSAKSNSVDETNELEESNESDDEEKESDEMDESDPDEESDGGEKESADEGEKSNRDDEQKQVIKMKGNAKHHLQQKNLGEKKSRYVLFIGNIAYDTTKQDLEQHFEQVGKVTDVRIPTDLESNRPRGFAYVEFANEALYQKALDMDGTQLKNRKIKVEYSQGGQKKSEFKKKEIKAKNFKLHAMRKQGKFGAGNVPNRRGFKARGKK